MLMATLFIIGKSGNKPNFPQFIFELAKQNVVYLYNGILFSFKKDWKYPHMLQHELTENIMPNGRSQIQKSMYCMISLLKCQNRQIYGDNK